MTDYDPDQMAHSEAIFMLRKGLKHGEVPEKYEPAIERCREAFGETLMEALNDIPPEKRAGKYRPTHSDADPETRIVDTPTPEGCPGVVVGWRGGGKSVVHPPGVDCPVHPWRTSYGSDADPSGEDLREDAAETIDWLLDLLEMYDEKLIELGEPEEKVRSDVHQQGKAKARDILRRLRRTEDDGRGGGGVKRGNVLKLVGGPWDGQEVYVPTTPREPGQLIFPAMWRDGRWDNAHAVWWYELGPVKVEPRQPSAQWPLVYECRGLRPSYGLTDSEKEDVRQKIRSGLIVSDPEKYPEQDAVTVEAG